MPGCVIVFSPEAYVWERALVELMVAVGIIGIVACLGATPNTDLSGVEV